ncbi:pantoate--beta-alanine ligase [Aridibaculum aurantiacum]|uniref:pantoate--beta-alanine ligase n=1 Tax=Aridibaculum aurantiacum TaxID=2810307 RepID=UPI001A95936D|nr:pantoate--beta-alanine ligase [Aridibaculum aurantiacum]
MLVFTDINNLSQHIASLRSAGKTIGFVPTMGALHPGHLSLVALSKQQANITVVSIFVNPTQFNDPKDFEKYPVTTDNDIQLLEKSGADIVFLPSVKEIYPGGMQATMHYDLGELENLLEGKFRPGHFQGVAQVVHRLLDIVVPDVLFLGIKDYQQCMVIKRLLQLINHQVTLVTGDTFRETTGLAMSSRNLRLSETEKQQATAIHKALLYIKENYKSRDLQELEKEASDMLLSNGFDKVDYVAIADSDTLQPAMPGQQDKLVALVAAFIGNVRLIDNIMVSE